MEKERALEVNNILYLIDGTSYVRDVVEKLLDDMYGGGDICTVDERFADSLLAFIDMEIKRLETKLKEM